MMKKLLVVGLLFLTACGVQVPESATEKVEVVEITMDTQKGPEIATERVITFTAASTEIVTTEVLTEEITEESTGGIDVDGYGWVQLQYSAPYDIMEGHLTRSNGSIRCFGHRETWYSTNEGCGKNTAWSIHGKHVADDGTIRDEDGFICVASSDHRKHTIVMTSVGPGKVYDTGCSHGTIDVYTNW